LDDRHTYSRDYLLNSISILLGGRVAEELVIGQLTTGSGNDIERATKIARKMVCEWGMSDRLGPLNYGKNEEPIFLGREITHNRDFSEQTAQGIDEELKDLIDRCYTRAKGLVSKHITSLHAVANALLEKEVLDGQEIDTIIRVADAPGLPV
ncbi:MAG: ftsH, partial [Deltaproteobacteria bacterium]|nr:ftsH [Deltaproteobacteria bacterium]